MSAPIDIQNLLDHQVVESGSDGSLPVQPNNEAAGWAAGSWAGNVRVGVSSTTSPGNIITRENGQYKVETGTVAAWYGANFEEWNIGSQPQNESNGRVGNGSILISDCVFTTPSNGVPDGVDGWNFWAGFLGGSNRDKDFTLTNYPGNTWRVQINSANGTVIDLGIPVENNRTYRTTLVIYGDGNGECYLDGKLVWAGPVVAKDEIIWGHISVWNSDTATTNFIFYIDYLKVYAIVPPPTFTVAAQAEIVPGTATTRTDHKDT